MGYVHIPVVKLVERIGDPFRNQAWGNISRDMVRDSILHGTYDRAHWSYSHEPTPTGACSNLQAVSEWHAQRIAYLHMRGWTEPIEIDVGIPSLGYWPYPLIDGHHRLCAAVYRGDIEIAASVAGSLDYAFELFGVDCADPDYAEMES